LNSAKPTSEHFRWQTSLTSSSKLEKESPSDYKTGCTPCFESTFESLFVKEFANWFSSKSSKTSIDAFASYDAKLTSVPEIVNG
jgi:hypothetical protein